MMTARYALGCGALFLAAACAAPPPEAPVAGHAPEAEAPAADDAQDEAAPDPHRALRDELLEMDRTEESLRSALSEASPESPHFAEVSARLDSVERAHAARLREIIEIHGWPTAGEVGGEASHAALVAVLRARDTELQERALEALREAYERGETAGEPLAMLTDRLRLRRGEPQLYGTQISIAERDVSVGPLEDPERVDERRTELGLMPLEAYLDLVRGALED